jgi:AraC family transcriptional regulator
MSPYHFARLFKESTGLSPYQYVIEARVRKAKELLTTGKFTISEAAYHVGFVDQSHLTRHFKKTTRADRSESAHPRTQDRTGHERALIIFAMGPFVKTF